MGVKRVFTRTTLHALPRAVQAKSLTARIFWSVVLFVALSIVLMHSTFLVIRYQRHDVSTTYSMKFNQNVTKPILYLTLFFPQMIESEFPFKTVLTEISESVYEFSDWTNATAGGFSFVVNFCAAQWEGLQVLKLPMGMHFDTQT